MSWRGSWSPLPVRGGSKPSVQLTIDFRSPLRKKEQKVHGETSRRSSFAQEVRIVRFANVASSNLILLIGVRLVVLILTSALLAVFPVFTLL